MAGDVLQELLIADLHRATIDDVDVFVPKLRQADLDEIRAASKGDPCAALAYGVFRGASAAYDDNGEPVCIFGANLEPPSPGYVWMLGTDAITQNSVEFLRSSKGIVEGWAAEIGVLWTLSDGRNEVHHRWLRWLGFEHLGTVENADGLPFLYFHRENEFV